MSLKLLQYAAAAARAAEGRAPPVLGPPPAVVDPKDPLWRLAASLLAPCGALAGHRRGRLALLSGAAGTALFCDILTGACLAAASARCPADPASAEAGPGGRQSGHAPPGQPSQGAASDGVGPSAERAHGLRKRPRGEDGEMESDDPSNLPESVPETAVAADACARACLRVLGSTWFSEEALYYQNRAFARSVASAAAPGPDSAAPSAEANQHRAESPVLPEATQARRTLAALQRWRAVARPRARQSLQQGSGVGAGGTGLHDDASVAAALAALLTLASEAGHGAAAPSQSVDALPEPLRSLLRSERFFRENWELLPLLLEAPSALSPAFQARFCHRMRESATLCCLLCTMFGRFL